MEKLIKELFMQMFSQYLDRSIWTSDNYLDDQIKYTEYMS